SAAAAQHKPMLNQVLTSSNKIAHQPLTSAGAIEEARQIILFREWTYSVACIKLSDRKQS
ncbi:hypothetical protein AAII07_59760, partial [Microvirga sp. 0TCS3.31]